MNYTSQKVSTYVYTPRESDHRRVRMCTNGLKVSTFSVTCWQEKNCFFM